MSFGRLMRSVPSRRRDVDQGGVAVEVPHARVDLCQRDAQIIRAEAEANAAKIYADAFNKDPEFYDFYRAMQSYRQTFQTGNGSSQIIMDGGNDYLRQFRGGR